ncbi:molecular chaperone [Klebsiella huaxiensis]|uniref:fimbrial biogenesis chaperone n=1 Tax=Klebsiella huaxiensis TaxID=2153354 RepID=UPI0031688927
MKKRNLFSSLMLTLIVSISLPASGAVVITGTRVIYPAAEKEVSVKMNNNGSSPVLVQSWIDNGDRRSTPENAKAPFFITPPVNRVNAGRGQVLRIRYTGETLPQDKESVFYLNVLEVPPKVKNADGQNMLHMAFRSRLKLFFRPSGLVGKAVDAPEKVTWTRSGNRITAQNPTPFHVSVALFTDDENGKTPIGDGGMIKPGETRSFTLNTSPTRFYPVIINDYGAMKVIKPTAK